MEAANLPGMALAITHGGQLVRAQGLWRGRGRPTDDPADVATFFGRVFTHRQLFRAMPNITLWLAVAALTGMALVIYRTTALMKAVGLMSHSPPASSNASKRYWPEGRAPRRRRAWRRSCGRRRRSA
jgi:hypothetical protein